MEEQMSPTCHKASESPEKDLKSIENNISKPIYRRGYERFFNKLPNLSGTSSHLMEKAAMASDVMNELFSLLQDEAWIHEDMPEPKSYYRTVIGLEKPTVKTKDFFNHETEIESGATIIVVKWGDGLEIPCHGHGYGFLYESVLAGKFVNNIFRQIGDTERVRLVRTEILEAGYKAYSFHKNETGTEQRNNYLHSLKAVGNVISLDFVPEHPRDGVGNTFTPEWFEDHFIKVGEWRFTPVSTLEAMYLRVGDLCLVKSPSLPELGAHWMVVTGPPIEKAHGVRPESIQLSACHSMEEQFEDIDVDSDMPIILKANPCIRDLFLKFHGMKLENNQIVLP